MQHHSRFSSIRAALAGRLVAPGMCDEDENVLDILNPRAGRFEAAGLKRTAGLQAGPHAHR